MFRETCATRGLKHIRTRPDTHRTNGKAGRFIQAELRQWADAASDRTVKERASGSPRWLHECGFYRSISALQNKPPIGRIEATVNNVLPRGG